MCCGRVAQLDLLLFCTLLVMYFSIFCSLHGDTSCLPIVEPDFVIQFILDWSSLNMQITTTCLISVFVSSVSLSPVRISGVQQPVPDEISVSTNASVLNLPGAVSAESFIPC